MVSELSFLIDLLLNHKLSAATKSHISKRIKDVEESLSLSRSNAIPILHNGSVLPSRITPQTSPPLVDGAPQAASTLAAMQRHAGVEHIISTPPPVEPVKVIAQTPQTAAAMQQREQMIANAIAGKSSKRAPLVVERK